MENINVKVEAVDNELIVTHRKGDALPLKEPAVINFTGELPSVSNYLAIHGVNGKWATIQQQDDTLKAGDYGPVNENYVHPEQAVIYVNRKNRSIQLVTDSKSAYAHRITGQLELSDELVRFDINPSVNSRSREALVKLLRFSKRFFTDAGTYEKVLEAYQKFNVKTTANLTAESDNRGNKNIGYQKEISDTSLPTTIMLEIPVFKGYPPVKFLVEICMDTTEHQAIFWFESPELEQIIDTKAKELIEAELKLIGDKYVVVYQ